MWVCNDYNHTSGTPLEAVKEFSDPMDGPRKRQLQKDNDPGRRRVHPPFPHPRSSPRFLANFGTLAFLLTAIAATDSHYVVSCSMHPRQRPIRKSSTGNPDTKLLLENPRNLSRLSPGQNVTSPNRASSMEATL